MALQRIGLVCSILLAGSLVAPGTASACGWDNETYYAEGDKLPCVTDALLGFVAEHTPEYYEARIAAMDEALAVVPSWLEGLDNKGIALLHLGRLDEAEVVMKRRHELTPEAYAGHANLGTLYTFMGRLDEAEKHIRAAMAIEPDAHFGREKVHLDFVVHLRAVAGDESLAGRNFMGLELSQSERLEPKRGALEAAGVGPRDLDALVAMLTIYGARDNPDILYAMGDILVLRGMTRLAWTAYRRARAEGHPNVRELVLLEKALSGQLEAEWERENPEKVDSEEGYGPLGGGVYRRRRSMSAEFRQEYQAWEREQLAQGLAVWTREGLERIYAEIDERRPRCKTVPVPKSDKAAKPEEKDP